MDEQFLNQTEQDFVSNILSKLFTSFSDVDADNAAGYITKLDESRARLVIESINNNFQFNQRLRRDYLSSFIAKDSTRPSKNELENVLIQFNNSNYSNYNFTVNDERISINTTSAEFTEQVKLYLSAQKSFSSLMMRLYAFYNVSNILSLLFSVSSEELSILRSRIESFINSTRSNPIDLLHRVPLLPNDVYTLLEKHHLRPKVNNAQTLVEVISILKDFLYIIVSILENRKQSVPLDKDSLSKQVGLLLFISGAELELY